MKIKFLFEDSAFSQLDKTSKLILAHWRNDDSIPNSLRKKFARSSDKEILNYITDLVTRYVNANIRSLKQDVVIAWLLKAYSNGTPFEDLLRRGSKAIGQYSNLLHTKAFKGNHSDLNTYRTVEELEQYMDTLYSEMQKDEVVDFSKAKAVKIWEDSNLLIVVPLNKEAAGKYGAGTRWCTTDQDCDDIDEDDYDDDDNYDRHGNRLPEKEFDPEEHTKTTVANSFENDGSTFAHYFRNGPLVIFIDKRRPDEKFQFHAPSHQAMDPSDSDVSPASFKNEYPGAITKAVTGLKQHAAEFTGFIKDVNTKADRFMKTFKKFD